MLSAYCGTDVLWVGRSRWVEHYILKGVTDALFLVVQNFHNRTVIQKQMLGWLHGMYHILLRSVLRGCFVLPSKAHFTGVLYTPAWVFLWQFFLLGCGRSRRVEQAEVSTHVFCVWLIVLRQVQSGWLLNTIDNCHEKTRNIELCHKVNKLKTAKHSNTH